MKKLFAAALLALTSVAFGATLTPVQLLNPAGSTAGQVIASTGASTAPAWTTITLSGLTGTVALANGGTGATTAANARTNLGLGTAATQNTGTSGANVPLLNGANTWSSAQTFSAAITPSQTAGIVGTTTNNSVTAGSIGEYVTATGSSVALTTATNANVTSISLTAGDWDVSGGGSLQSASSGTLTNSILGISTTSATFGGTGTLWNLAFGIGANGGVAQALPTVRVSVAATTTVYCVAQGTFSSGSASASCLLRARRVR